MVKAALLTTAATFALAAPALATDLYVPPAEPVHEHPGKTVDWNGFYAGVHGGGGWGGIHSTCVNFIAGKADCDDVDDLDLAIQGPYVGVQGGFNAVFGNGLLLGIEADANWSGIDGEGVQNIILDRTTNYDLDWFGTVRGRVGYVMGHWMPYVTGGWAWGHATQRIEFLGFQADSAGYHGGWTVGAGVEWGIARNWTAKAEYKYIDFGSASFNYPDFFDLLVVDVDTDIHTLEFGLNYQFGERWWGGDVEAADHPGKTIDWNGFYAGVHGGGGWGGIHSTCVAFEAGGCVDEVDDLDFAVQGPYVGVQGGLNWLVGNGLLLGIEADANWSGIDGEGVQDIAGDELVNYDLDWFGTARGRVGYVMGHWMPYVTGGWAWAHATQRLLLGDDLLSSSGSYHGGWTVGAGVEWGIAGGWTLKGEYKYIDFGSANFSYPDFDGLVLDIDTRIHTFELGLNCQF